MTLYLVVEIIMETLFCVNISGWAAQLSSSNTILLWLGKPILSLWAQTSGIKFFSNLSRVNILVIHTCLTFNAFQGSGMSTFRNYHYSIFSNTHNNCDSFFCIFYTCWCSYFWCWYVASVFFGKYYHFIYLCSSSHCMMHLLWTQIFIVIWTNFECTSVNASAACKSADNFFPTRS